MRQAAVRSSIALAAMATASLVALAATPAPPRAATSAAPAASAASAAAVAPLADACPAQLAVKQTVSDAIAGWTPLNQQASYPFVRVAFYPGPPADSTLIVPTQEYKGQAGLHDSWDLPHRAGGYWMTCSYGNTTASVARKLPDDTDYCRADYDGRFITLVVKHWACGVKRTMAPPAWVRPPVRSNAKPAPKPAIKRVE
ncbi:STY0301 family protein [Scleromatobacter humisilvae]|uniref:Uncharacterized protein n=1 Tax=Scleromatobacter humisilvae TaxID=2897159 RepID=A0A9X1YKD2_9BURK|nr:STY0301 family protein [Scleromatobacter humisilvae]MCK9688134.1 hypothetical protein [Scleromatobacter humisilvae]